MKAAADYGMQQCNLPFIVNTLWDQRFLTQSTDLHVIATLLVQRNRAIKKGGQTPESGFGAFVTGFFQRFAPSDQIAMCIRDF